MQKMSTVVFPRLVFMDWRLPLSRDCSYQDELKLPPWFICVYKLCLLIHCIQRTPPPCSLHTAVLPSCSTAYSKHAECLGCCSFSIWEPRPPLPAFLYLCVHVLSSFPHYPLSGCRTKPCKDKVATKLEDLNSIARTYMMENENSSKLFYTHVVTCTGKCTQVESKC